MNTPTLVRMANQIAGFFRAQPGDAAVAATADHIKKFWDSRMRKDLAVHRATIRFTRLKRRKACRKRR